MMDTMGFDVRSMQLQAAMDIGKKTGQLPDDWKGYEFSAEMVSEYKRTGKIPASWTPDFRVQNDYRPDLRRERIKTAYLFENIRKEAKYFWKELETLKTEIDSQLEAYSARHNEKAVAEKREDLKAEYVKTASGYAQSLREYAKQAGDAKAKAINDAISQAPTTEQLNILKSLEMEGAEITEDEITAILPTLFENYRALRTLNAIAKKNHIVLDIPPQYDGERLKETLAFIVQYINDRADDLMEFANTGKWPFYHDGDEYFFLDYPWTLFDDPAAILDGNEQIQNSKVYVKPRELTDTERKIVEEIGSCDPRELKATLNKAAESPEIRRLILLHPDYAPYLDPQPNL